MNGLMAALSTRVSRFVCGLGGHELLLHAEPGKLSLRCMSCAYETPGWAIKEPNVRPRQHGSGALVNRRAHA